MRDETFFSIDKKNRGKVGVPRELSTGHDSLNERMREMRDRRKARPRERERDEREKRITRKRT